MASNLKENKPYEKENKELKERVDNLTIQRNHAADLLCFYERDDIK